MGKTQDIKKEVPKIPSYEEEASKSLAQIGDLQRQIARINNAFENLVERLKQRAMEKTAPREVQIEQLFQGLYMFAQSHRKELTEDGKKKTIQWPTGEISWRTTPPAVNIKNMKQAVATLKALGLNQFIRTIEEIDKETILKEYREKGAIQKIKGISVGQKEVFVAKPSKLQLEISKNVKSPKKE